MPGDSSLPSSPGLPDLPVHLGGEQAARWALNCPGGGRRSLLLVVHCCPEGDAELTLSVLHSHTHHVKIHSVLLQKKALAPLQGTVILPGMGNFSFALLKLPSPALPIKMGCPGRHWWAIGDCRGETAPHHLPQNLPAWISRV